MATTQQLRGDFRHPFIKGFRSDGRPICDYSSAVKVRFLAGGPWAERGYIDLAVHPNAAELMVAIAAVFHHHGYTFDETAGGTVSCRNITGASAYRINLQISRQYPYATSLHAHGIALDINPSRNRYRVSAGLIQWGRQTDLPKALIADIEAIKTKAGNRAVQWGGRWTNIKDPMHFEPDRRRAELDGGIDRTTVKGLEAYLAWAGNHTTPPNEEEQMLKKGQTGNAVQRMQQALLAWNDDALPEWGADGDFGSETETWVRRYQAAADLEETGTGDGVTLALLLEHLPDHAAGGGVDAYTKTEADGRFARKTHPHNARTVIE